MNRIARRDYSHTHPEVNKWLRHFMIDIKKMFYIDKTFQPFTMERLEEWTKHRTDLESCFDWESSFIKRLSDNPVYEHADAIFCFNGLVIDLKLRVSGLPYDEITEERINEAEKYFIEIDRCQKRRTLFY